MHYLGLLFVAALSSASPVERERLKSRQGPVQITIDSLVFSGSGCPTNSVTQSLSPDGTIVTLGFNSFQTYIGPGYTLADNSKNCQIHLSLQYPGGFTYSVVDAVYHGYAQLGAGVTGTFLSTYYFSQSASNTETTRSTISGSDWLSGNTYTKEDDLQTATTIWSPCGDTGILNINNRVSLSANSSSAAGQLTDDDATVAFTHQIQVAWKPCVPLGSSSSGSSFTTGVGSTALVPREPDATAPDSSSPSVWIGAGTTAVTPGGLGGYCDTADEFCILSGSTAAVTPGKQ